jgi:hypothetical protein
MSVIERERIEAPQVEREVTEADVLHRAADLLEEFGWCQVKWGSKEDGYFCAHGALMAAATDLGLGCGPVFGKAEQRIRELHGSILGWNDQLGRTKEEVVAGLREAAGGRVA